MRNLDQRSLSSLLLQPKSDAQSTPMAICMPKKGLMPMNKPNANPRAISLGAPLSLIKRSYIFTAAFFIAWYTGHFTYRLNPEIRCRQEDHRKI